jgi:hypothetical protein
VTPTASATPTPTLTPTPPDERPRPDASPAVDAAAAAAAEPDAAASARVKPRPSLALAPNHGALDLPKSAEGHRVYVDGHMIGEAPAPLVVTCGVHAIKVGSHGRPQNLFVPCGAHVRVRYP